jgi:hypothetical protein
MTIPFFIIQDAVGQWLSILKSHNNPDWLVVVVEGTEASKKANKLLPKATVVDRIKSDVCVKHPNSGACPSRTRPARRTRALRKRGKYTLVQHASVFSVPSHARHRQV